MIEMPLTWLVPPTHQARGDYGLDGGHDEVRGLRVDSDVPAEQNAADDLPGGRGRGGGASCRPLVAGEGTGGTGLGHTGTTVLGAWQVLAHHPAALVGQEYRLRRPSDDAEALQLVVSGVADV